MMNLLDDLVILSGVSDSLLKKFLPLIEYSVLNSIYESSCENRPLTIVDIEFGTLQFYVTDDKILYKFIPSKEFEKKLTDMIVSKKSPIISKLESNIQNKIERTYKELL